MNVEIKTARELSQIIRDKARKKECLHPNSPTECKGKIVKAHTVQLALLKKIARNNHVYTPDIDMNADEDPWRMARKGLKQASTFTGFCSYHDNQMFASIEKRALELTESNIFLLTYRSMARGFYVSRENTHLSMFNPDTPLLSDKDFGPIHGVYIEDPSFEEQVMKDLEVFAKMQKAYARGDCDGTKFCAIQLDSLPEILCSGMTNVEFDFAGQRLQSVVQEKPQDLLTMSLLPYRTNYGVALFSWYGGSDVNESFVRSLLAIPERDIPNAIVRFIFQHFENFFVSPPWWDNLSATIQEQLLGRFTSTFYAESYFFIDLAADDMNYVDWNVTDIETNL